MSCEEHYSCGVDCISEDTMRSEIRRLRAQVKRVKDYEEALKIINGFDRRPELHAKDANDCSICTARAVLEKHGVKG